MRHFYFTLFCLAAVCGLLALGFWQLQRLEWKESLLESVERNSQLPPLALSPAGFSELFFKPEDYRFRTVTVTGNYLPGTTLVGPKYRDGVPGYDVINFFEPSVMILPNLKIAIAVNRGWTAKKETTEPDTKKRTVTGVLLPSRKPAPWMSWGFAGKDDHICATMNVPDMAARIASPEMRVMSSYTTMFSLYLQQRSPDPDQAIRPYDELPETRNDHLQYAITWFSLALVITLMYFAHLRARRR